VALASNDVRDPIFSGVARRSIVGSLASLQFQRHHFLPRRGFGRTFSAGRSMPVSALSPHLLLRRQRPPPTVESPFALYRFDALTSK
jgi:hypothetical protein